jgi:hypothetical protein
MGVVHMGATRSTRRLLVATLTAALMAFVAPQMAQASTTPPQSGVHVDPGSPAGKEYQFPVTGARSEAAGGSPQSGSAGPPLFGVGVTPAAAATGSTATTSAHSTKAGAAVSRSGAAATGANEAPGAGVGSGPGAAGAGAGSGSGAAGSGSSPGGAKPGSVDAIPVAAGTGSGGAGGSGWIPLVAGGLLVLVIGGGGGLALRQRVQRS